LYADGRKDRQTDRYDEANSPYRNFANVPKKSLQLHRAFWIFTKYLTPTNALVVYHIWGKFNKLVTNRDLKETNGDNDIQQNLFFNVISKQI